MRVTTINGFDYLVTEITTNHQRVDSLIKLKKGTVLGIGLTEFTLLFTLAEDILPIYSSRVILEVGSVVRVALSSLTGEEVYENIPLSYNSFTATHCYYPYESELIKYLNLPFGL